MPASAVTKSRTIRYLNNHRRRRRKDSAMAAGPALVVAIALAFMLLIWSMGAMIVSFHDNNKRRHHIVSSSSSNYPVFPRTVLDLWPESMEALQLFFVEDGDNNNNLLSSCLPRDHPTKCRIGGDGSQTTTKIIGILRPPGHLGQVMESFVRSFVEYLVQEEEEEEQVDTTKASLQVMASHLYTPLLANNEDELNAQMPNENKSSITHIVRPASLPPLLEALDLILQTRDQTNDDNSKTTVAKIQQDLSTISVDQVEVVLRQVVRWHCHVSHQATGRAMLTLFIDETIGYPRMGQASLASFLLDGEEEDIDKVVVDMNPLAETLFHRIEEATVLAEHIFAASSQESTNEWANRVIRNELEQLSSKASSLSCLSPLDFATIPLPQTRATELVGAFLEGSASATKEACQKYPQSILCREYFARE